MRTMVNVHDEVNTTQYVDAQTGEILDEKKSKRRKVTKQEVKNKRPDYFFNVYDESSLFGTLLSLTGAELSTLMACASASQPYTDTTMERFGYPGNIVTANGKFRQWVCATSGLKDSTVKGALGSLVKKGLMERDPQTDGIYYLNPIVIFKGYSGIRTKLLNATTVETLLETDLEASPLKADAAEVADWEEVTDEEPDGEQA